MVIFIFLDGDGFLKWEKEGIYWVFSVIVFLRDGIYYCLGIKWELFSVFNEVYVLV